MANSEVLRDFCGTLKSKVNLDDSEMLKAVEAWNISLAVVNKYCREYLSSCREHVSSNATNNEVRKYTAFIVSNIMADIMETGMYSETRDFMLRVLHTPAPVSREEVIKFSEDYFDDLAGECAISRSDVDAVAKDILSGK